RTAAVNHGDAVPATKGCRRRIDAALTEGPMHPDVLDPELGALSHCPLSLVRRRGNDDGVNTSWDAPQVVITVSPLDLVRIRIDREHLITSIPQTLEHGVGSMLPGLSRHACHGDPLESKELGCGFLHRWHRPPPSRFLASTGTRTHP